MNLNAPLGAVESVKGVKAVIAYVVGITVGAAFALPILAALFGISLPVV